MLDFNSSDWFYINPMEYPSGKRIESYLLLSVRFFHEDREAVTEFRTESLKDVTEGFIRQRLAAGELRIYNTSKFYNGALEHHGPPPYNPEILAKIYEEIKVYDPIHGWKK